MTEEEEKLGKLFLGEERWDKLNMYQKMIELMTIKEYLNKPKSEDYNIQDSLVIEKESMDRLIKKGKAKFIKKEKRKIVQISSNVYDGEKHEINGVKTHVCVIALCDDGTIWAIDTENEHGLEWERLPEIPQE